MEITKVKKGERECLPCSIVGGHDGCTAGQVAPEDGVLIRFTALEKATGAVFASDVQMQEAGYVPLRSQQERARMLVVLLGRDELVEIASRLNLKASGTKQDLAKRISTCF